jgi:hypothetical protein
MREAFGKILPGMGAGIGADKAFLPIRRWPVLVVSLKRCAIIGALVAEDSTKGVELPAITDKLIPDEMACLMAEVAEQSAIRLVH